MGTEVIPPVVTADKPWTEGLDAELIGHAQNRKWDTLAPAEAARNAVKAHREAERLIGVPADQVIKLPQKADDVAAWNGVYERLGAPKEGKYDFSNVKFKDGTVLDQPFVDMLTRAAQKAHVSQNGAVDFAKEVVAMIESSDVTDATNRQATVDTEKKALRESWGKNFDAFVVGAKRTAEVLGVKPEAVAALESQVGYKAVMDMFHAINGAVSEDVLVRVRTGGGNGNGAITKEQAVARRAELQADPEWKKRYLAGGAAENRELQSLIAIEHSAGA